MTDQRKSALQRVIELALTVEESTGLPAELLVAQCCLWSDFLNNVPGNNPLGILKTDRHPALQMIQKTVTLQGENRRLMLAFAAFGKIEEAFEDYARLITTGRAFNAAWVQYLEDRAAMGLITRVAKIYDTDPAYSDKLCRMATELKNHVAAARRPIAAKAAAGK